MEDSGEPMTGMLDTNAPDNGDAPAMEVAGVDDVTEPTVAQAPPLPNPESHECEQIQQASASEQYQLYSTEQLQSAAENDDTTASPSGPSAESLGQQPESNGQHMEPDAANQDSESPSNMELEDAPKETPEAVEPATDADPAQDPALPADYERLFKVVEDNPEDFNGWVYLLQYVEQESHLEASRKAFDAFFLHYPYCYGYWKKYADIEKKHGYIHMADEVYRRGLQAIPLSVDLWLHYIAFLRENQDTSDGEAENRIRASYEHAVLACGTDFRSDRLWEAYIAWETEQGKLANVTAVYDRILCIPTQLYSQHFQKFKEHVQSNNPKHFLSEEEFVQLRVELANENKPSGDDAPGEELPPGTEDLPDPAKRVTEIENMRHKVTETRQEVFNHNEHEVSKRWAFEEGIKRPYFHVKALEKTQLNNWREYLDFELENGTPERVVVLFERCLIACALYEEFWIKVATRSCRSRLIPSLHPLTSLITSTVKLAALFACNVDIWDVSTGDIEEARRILKAMEEAVPGLAMVRMRRVSLERRHGNMDEAEALLRDGITNGKNSSEASFYAVKLARQLVKVQKSIGKAKKVLLEAVEKDETNPKLYLNLLELEYSGDVQQNEAEIMAGFDRALSSTMPLEQRLIFSQRKVEFLEDFGSDVNLLVAAYEQHQRLTTEQESLKRKAENGSEEPDSKRQRTDDQSGASAQMMQDMQANHAGYNYNNWYQYNSWGGQNSWGQYGQYNQYYPPPPT
ncbi:pre-mRNA-processing factor 39 [Sinocyclocheilus rhinocerous]|uniref:pre-mRNA-processing factor 39 n=1 Tax=Sinocyclocheilus rhinocerous TaxID=307959 RepID=UPI0007B837A8|nr:PREDICTED: pre-mRNA-processing factor 39 [Sinocyclocheilus rhinocerous]